MGLVGRDAEQATLRRLLDAPPGARTPVVLVSGEAGAGKTALVEHALAGREVRRGRAGEWRAAAYDVLAQALRPLPPTGSAERAVPAVLAAVLPELGAPPGRVGASLLAAAVRDALTGPVVVLDDLHWADDDMLDLLPALADALRGGPLLVGCYRDDELPRGHRLRPVRAELRRRGLLTEIALGPLDDAAVAGMLAGLLGGPPDPDLAAAIARRSEGVPFAVEELATAGADDPVPDGIREAVLLRTGRLPAEARAVLEAAAVVGTAFDPADALALAGAAEWPEELADSGLLGPDGFRHALTRDAVYAGVPWSRRRRLHAALAGRLSAAGAPPALVADHLLAARETAAACVALTEAADGHLRVHAHRDAARALRTVVELSATPDLGVVDRLASCAEMCADHAESVVLLTELAEGWSRAGDPAAVAGARRRLALAYELLGQWDRALAEREAAAAAFTAAGLPAEAATERIAAAAHLRSASSYRASLDVLALARADAAAAGRTDLLLRAEGHRGNALARMGRGTEGVGVARAALDGALAGGHAVVAAEVYQRLADALEHAGDYSGAREAYASAYQFCDLHDLEATGALCRACASVVLFVSGRWDRAADVTGEVLARADGPPHPYAVAACVAGLVQAMRGRPARARLLEARSIATRIELVPIEILCAWGLAVLDDQAGDAGSAAGHVRAALRRWEETEECHYSVPVLQWASTFLAGAGSRECAAALAEIARRTAQPEAGAALGHALGEVALLDGEPAAAAAELGRAADQFAALGLPLAEAQSRARAGTALLAAGDRDGGVRELRAARVVAERLRADVLTDRIAAALGERPTRRGRSTAPGGLSGREAEVMRLVARGRTSREIGTELFLSPRTVEMHVRNSLQKLGCRTRAEAVRRLAELGVD